LSVQALAALPSDSTSSLRRPSSPPALPRTSLAASPPKPNFQLSSSALPCGAAPGISLRQPLRPCLEPSLRPALLDPTYESHRLPSALRRCLRNSTSSLRRPSSPPALPRIRLRLASPPNPSDLSRRLFIVSSILRPPFLPDLRPALPVSPSGLPCGFPSGFALRLSFRSRLAPFASAQPSGRLPAYTRLRLEPCGSRLHLLLPSSQPSGRLSLRCPAFASRPVLSRPSGNAIQLEPLTPGPNLAARVARLRPAFGIVSPACAFNPTPRHRP